MDCHNCKFVGNVPGSTHKSCTLVEDSAARLLLTSGSLEITVTDKKTGEKSPAIEVNDWGRSHGWADWPLQFDPIWIDKCVFFTKNNHS